MSVVVVADLVVRRKVSVAASQLKGNERLALGRSASSEIPGGLESAPSQFNSSQVAIVEKLRSSDSEIKKLRLAVVGIALVPLLAVVLVGVGFATARHWIKVDVPEQAESFHHEEFLTGKYLITDDGVSPCYVDQDWTDCINEMESQHASSCGQL